MDNHKKILELRKILHEHNHLYYVKNEPKISDYEFDLMLNELEKLELEYPEFDDPNSPTKRVGSSLSNDFRTSEHNFQMYSLENSYSRADLIDWENRIRKKIDSSQISYCCELKLDGVSVSLSYKNGDLVKGLTRGDGVNGDNVTENLKTIKTIPLKIDSKIDFDIRGEVVIEKSDFDKLNEKRALKGESKYMNPRNTASGSIKLINSREVSQRPLKCYSFQIVGNDLSFRSQIESLKFAEEQGFNILDSYKFCKNLDEVFEFLDYWEHKKNSLNFEIDGVVVKVNKLEFQNQLGYTSKFPRWAIAYKFKTEQAISKLLSIDYQVGRTGAITPVANLQPVLLNGTIVKRASLHNSDQIKKIDLYENDFVFIEKGGEIIPKIVSVNKQKRTNNSKPVVFTKTCPSCKSILTKVKGEAQHYCLNHKNCHPQILGRIKHFISRKAMNIDGFGTETVDRLLENNMIKNFSDIYYLTKEKICSLERMGEKSAINLIDSIINSKNQPFHKVLYSLGIRYVGETVSKKICKEVRSIDELINLKYDQIILIDEIGEKIAQSLINYFNDEDNIRLIDELKLIGLNFESNNQTISSKLNSGKFVISGTFEEIDRNSLKNLIEINGGKLSSSISSKTDFLIKGENVGPSKLKKAQQFGVKIISFSEFINYFKIDLND